MTKAPRASSGQSARDFSNNTAFPAPHPRLPVLVLTGYLGSGKTTLLNSLLQQWPDTAVIINEFGTTPIDQRLLMQTGIPLMTLSGGCLCCRLRGALPPMLKNLRMAFQRPGTPAYQRLVIETSGIASPEPIIETLLRDRWLAPRYQLLGIVATVSAHLGHHHLDRFPEVCHQIAFADVLVMTHTDLVDTEALQSFTDRLAALAPATPMLTALHGQLDLSDLMSAAGHSGQRFKKISELPEAHNYESLSVNLQRPLGWSRFAEIFLQLEAEYPGRVVRIKGVIKEEGTGKSFSVQAVAGHLYPPAGLPDGTVNDNFGQLVIITAGTADQLSGWLENRLAEASCNSIEVSSIH